MPRSSRPNTVDAVLVGVLACCALFVASLGGAILAGVTLGVDPATLDAGQDPIFDGWLIGWALPLQAGLILWLVAGRLQRLGLSATDTLGLVRGHRWWTVALVLPAGLCADRAVALLQRFFPHSGGAGLEELALLPPTVGALGAVLALGLVVIGPLSEEVLFRGFILQGLRADGSPSRAIVLTALLFGLFHFDPIHIVGAAVLGLYLGWLRVVTGSLFAALCAHALNNGIWWVLVRRGHTGELTTWTLDLIALGIVLAAVWATRDALSEVAG